MTDFRSVEKLEVFRQDEFVGTLRRIPKGSEFQYPDAFLNSDQPAIALHLPKNTSGLRTEGIANLPTYFAGLLPEGVMFTAVRRTIGAAADDLFAILAATGADAIGDIEARIPGEPARQSPLRLTEAAAQIESLLSGSDSFSVFHLAAISGVQPKLSVGELMRASRRSQYIAKFEPPEFPGLLQNEHDFTRLAKLCRLHTSDTRLRGNALVIKRFDRIFDPSTKSLRKVHVEDLLQVMDLYPSSKYAVDFQEVMTAMQTLGVSKATLLEALQLYVFSYTIGNGDLHAKNLSLIFDSEDRQWRLSPVYDIVSTLPYQSILRDAGRMALALSDEDFGRFKIAHFVKFGLSFGLPEKAVSAMVRRTARSVLNFLPQIGSLDEESANTIRARAESLADVQS